MKPEGDSAPGAPSADEGQSGAPTSESATPIARRSAPPRPGSKAPPRLESLPEPKIEATPEDAAADALAARTVEKVAASIEAHGNAPPDPTRDAAPIADRGAEPTVDEEVANVPPAPAISPPVVPLPEPAPKADAPRERSSSIAPTSKREIVAVGSAPLPIPNFDGRSSSSPSVAPKAAKPPAPEEADEAPSSVPAKSSTTSRVIVLFGFVMIGAVAWAFFFR